MKNKLIDWNRNYNYVIIILALLLLSSLLFTYAEPETQPVNITNVQNSNLTDRSVIITWDTNILSNSVVKYGETSGNLDLEETHNPLVTNHEIFLDNLAQNTTYYYVVNSTSANGNSSESQETNFTTYEDTTPPQWSNKTDVPLSRDVYKASQNYTFSINWEDNTQLDKVILKHNFTGTEIVQELIGTNSYFKFQTENLSAGSYYWNMKANDSYNNVNQTINFEYKVDPALPLINLSMNGQENNIIIQQQNYVNLTAVANNNQGKIEILLDGNVIASGINNTNITKYFSSPGNYTVVARYNETQNYTQKNISYIIEVKQLVADLTLTKMQYSLSELAGYTINAPNGSNLSVEICGPFPQGAGFVECSTTNNNNINFPFGGAHKYTNKTGNYNIKATIKYKNLTLLDDENYTVINSIASNMVGATKLKINEQSSINSTASGSVGPYTYKWKLENGSIITGQNLKVKYAIPDNYDTTLSIKDAFGNEKNDTFTLTVKRYFDLNIKVRDRESNSPIYLAEVRTDGTSKFTDTNGDVNLQLFEDEYTVRFYADGYGSVTQTVDLNESKSLIVYLTQGDNSLTTSQSKIIELVKPSPNEKLDTRTVNFEATVYPTTAMNCILYVAITGDDWFREAKSYDVVDVQKLTHSEVLENNNEYSWKVQCKTPSGVTYSTDTRKFNTPGATVATLSNEVLDAGDLRQKIEDSLTNYDEFDLDTKQVADSLQFSQQIEKSLTSYDRIMRDINSLLYRRDLVTSEVEQKRNEYYNDIKSLEKSTISNIRVDSKESFVIYPKSEDLTRISNLYKESKQLVGNVDSLALQDLQNILVVKTRATHVELTYLDGTVKKITLIHKELTYGENLPDDVFIVEEVSKELAKTAGQITVLSDYKVINNDPLLRFDTSEKIVYYFDDYKNLELAKSLQTILMKEDLYSNRNLITGNITLSNLEIGSTTWLIILLVLLTGAYLIYSFDVVHKVFGHSTEKETEQLRMMINDAFEYLDAKDISRANFIFKEIRMTYENANFHTKQLVYLEAIKLRNTINVNFVETIIEQIRINLTNRDVSGALKNYSSLQRAKKEMGSDFNTYYVSALNELRNQLLQIFPETQNEIINIERGSA